jgi:hypothetical protein
MLKLGDRTLLLCFGNNKAAQCHIWEYINWKCFMSNRRAVRAMERRAIKNSGDKAVTEGERF